MDFRIAAWIVALVSTLHNLEEAILLPAWSRTAGRWHHPVEKGEFRFAVLVLALLTYAAVGRALLGGREGIGAYLLTGYALAMLLNVFVPHLLATLALLRYAPGTATGLLLNLPATSLLLSHAFREGHVHASRFLWAGPLVVWAFLALIPLLFAIGRRLTRRRVCCRGPREGGSA
jgi:hypothetical protein